MGRFNFQTTVDVSALNPEVSGSLIRVRVHRPEGDVNFIVDCGIYYQENKDGEEQTHDPNYDEFTFNPKKLAFALITHVHADHIGRLPLLVKRGFSNQVFCSSDTAKLLSLALYDNERVLTSNAVKKNQKPLYRTEEVSKTLRLVRPMEYGKTFEPIPGIKVTMFPNAHLVGAAIILVQVKSSCSEDVNVLFIGDYHKRNPFFDVPPLPAWVTALPIHIVTESTYGDTCSIETDTPVFADNIIGWLKQGKSTIIVPTLSLGRFQHIALILRNMKEHGTLDSDIPVYFGGSLAIAYSNMFYNELNIPDDRRDFLPHNSYFIDPTHGMMNFKLKGQQINRRIIVATSGNANYGQVSHYIARNIENPKAAIHFTSFLVPGSLGHDLLRAEHGTQVTIHSSEYTKIADVKTTSEFSGHAKKDQLVEFMMQFSNIKSVLVTHGEIPVKKNFAFYCKNMLVLRSENVAVLGTGYTIRLNPYGIAKSIAEREYPSP